MLSIQVYNSLFDYKQTVNPKDMLSDISYTANINGGQGELVLRLKRDINDSTFAYGDIVTIINHLVGENPIYSGYVTKIRRIQDKVSQYIEIVLLGFASMLTEKPYSCSFSSRTSDVIIKELIDSFGSPIFYDTGTIEVGPNLGVGSSSGTYLEVLESICTLAGMKFYIDQQGIVSVFTKPDNPTHTLTNKKDVESIEIEENIETVINSVHVYSREFPRLEAYYTDSASITEYGEKFIAIETNMYWQDAIDLYAEKYVNQRKEAKSSAVVTVNREYPLETIKPGDTIAIENFSYSLENLQVVKVSYDQDRCTIELESYSSFGGEVLNLNYK